MIRSVAILLVALGFYAAVPSPVLAQPQLAALSCDDILTRIDLSEEAGNVRPTCEAVANAVAGITGELPAWTGCVGQAELDPAAHAGRCLIMRSIADPSLELPDPADCDGIRRAYADGLAQASIQGAASEDGLDCDAAAEAALLWSAGRSDWLRCRNYKQANEASHAFSCLFHDDELVNIDPRNACAGVKSLYEERLLNAYGRLPDDYRPLKCSSADKILEEAQQRIVERQAERARAAELTAQIRERAMANRTNSTDEGGLIVAGAILLLLAAAANADAAPAAGYQPTPTFGPGSSSCTSGMGAVDMNIGYMLGC
ncbi:hypothetical protein OCH239_10910 [Roseivivax halodurans JCM 10272]|uniref:Uncharacterized protein n=1 Tax=Roseivivax halodurans JCM 10272 TaxID=1449350 RepID=X7EBV9_9RHOB|nr:hypothetical protein [Roseivivax halodurans]ETX13345.1 hypothetical protein OCH239_10910 [Roseivivax halodurans JCM 10272]